MHLGPKLAPNEVNLLFRFVQGNNRARAATEVLTARLQDNVPTLSYLKTTLCAGFHFEFVVDPWYLILLAVSPQIHTVFDLIEIMYRE
jgi:hypothetical protein